MLNDLRFCLVADVSDRGGPYPFAVCSVDGDTCSVVFLDFSSISLHVGDRPCVPSVFGRLPGNVSIEAELLALQAVDEEIERLSSRYGTAPSPGFDPLTEPYPRSIRLIAENGRLSFEAGRWLSSAAGWNEGDRIEVNFSRERMALELRLDRNGSSIVAADVPGILTSDRSWPVPRGMESDFDQYFDAYVFNSAVMVDLVLDVEKATMPIASPSAPEDMPHFWYYLTFPAVACSFVGGVAALAIRAFFL